MIKGTAKETSMNQSHNILKTTPARSKEDNDNDDVQSDVQGESKKRIPSLLVVLLSFIKFL